MKNLQDLEDTLNRELQHVSHWLIANKLSLNVKKSNALLFRTSNDSTELKLNISLNGSPIEEKSKAKYLGILLDNKLSYEHHTKHVRSKLIKGNAILIKTRHFIPSDILTNTYNAHIHSHIDYGFNVWGYAAQTHIKNVLTQQKKAVRILNWKKKTHESKPLFKASKILPLDANLQLNSGKLLWKVSNSTICPSLIPLFTKRDNNSNTFHVPHRRLDVSQNSLTYKGVKNWNSIPLEIRSSPTLDTFKHKYKTHLLNTF